MEAYFRKVFSQFHRHNPAAIHTSLLHPIFLLGLQALSFKVCSVFVFVFVLFFPYPYHWFQERGVLEAAFMTLQAIVSEDRNNPLKEASNDVIEKEGNALFVILFGVYTKN